MFLILYDDLGNCSQHKKINCTDINEETLEGIFAIRQVKRAERNYYESTKKLFIKHVPFI